jgi:autotransporter-associated beta strand protein
MHKVFTVLGIALLAAGTAWGQTNLWTNPIIGADPGLTNPYTTGDVVAANITVSGIGHGSDVIGRTGNDTFNTRHWNSASLNTNDYFYFTLTPDSGYALNFSSFAYSASASGTGPTSFAFRSSLDGFTADIGSPSATGTTISLSDASFQGLSSGVTFRLYGWGASSSVGTWGIQDFAFSGTVSSTAPTGNYWSGATNGGGSGVWTTAGTNWATNTGGAGRGAVQGSGTLIFADTAGTVTVSNGVSAAAGLQFATNGYTVTGSTITLAGADAASNTITTDAGVTATIDSQLSGTAGLTKAGAGTLTLGGANDYAGGTVVSAGELAGSTTSLQGNVTNNAV